MILNYFSLSNFRGAKNVVINVNGKTINKIITLIGLNESGKTTILEGLSLFPNVDQAAASIVKSQSSSDIANTLVPIHKTGVFSGDIDVTGSFTINNDDWESIKNIARDMGFDIDNERKIKTVQVTRRFIFENGDYIDKKVGSYWAGIDLFVRKSKRSKFELAILPEIGGAGREDSLWIKVVDHLRTKLPNIVYFPSFIVDIPRRIYISKYDGESIANSYYRRIIEHIFYESTDDISLQTHVIDRIDKYKNASNNSNWITKLQNSDDKDKIDAVFSRFSAIITEEVIGSWSKVFNRKTSSTRVDVKWFVDADIEQPYVEMRVSDGSSSYHVHQRSLGFRWYFSFLLFTKFGRDRSKTNFFIFDEPAANLHAKAQTELLNSFKKLSEGGDYVIYSTHSHHMIQPEWLSGAYIVENEAIDYDGRDALGAPEDTNIIATPYRKFVGENGSRISYFQPVIDRLQYNDPQILPNISQIIVEGASDFYAFSYALRRSKHARDLRITPGTGSGSLGTMISLAMSRGNKFSVLLDDDEAGRKSAAKYKDLFFLGSDNVITLSEISKDYKNKAIEYLISKNIKTKIADMYGNDKKSTIGNYLSEICASDIDDGLDSISIDALLSVIDFCVERMSR